MPSQFGGIEVEEEQVSQFGGIKVQPNALVPTSSEIPQSERSTLDLLLNQNTPRTAVDSGTSPLSFGQRLGAGMKLTPQGERQYIDAQPGVLSSFTAQDGKLYVITEGGGVQLADPSGPDLGDFGDIGGNVLQYGPEVVTGFATRSPAAAGLAAAGGNALRQGISAALPGDDGLGFEDRYNSAATDTLLAMGSAGTANAITKWFDMLRPTNITRSSINEAIEDTPFQQMSKDIEDRTGQYFTQAQYTNNQRLHNIEEGLRNDLGVSERTRVVHQDQMNIAVKDLTDTLGELSPNEVGLQGMGQRIIDNTNNVVKELRNARTTQATEDFGKVALLSEGGAVLPVPKYVEILDAEIAAAVESNTAASRLVAKELRDAKKSLHTATSSLESAGFILPGGGKIRPEGKNMGAAQMQARLSEYGTAMSGNGRTFVEMDKAADKRISKLLFGALKEDLQDTAALEIEGGFANALKTARDHYKKNSDLITEVRKTVFGSLINKTDDAVNQSPENAIRTLFRGTPSEIVEGLKIFDTIDPLLRVDAQKLYVQDLWERSVVAGSGQVPTAGKFGPLAENALQVENQSISKFLSLIDSAASRKTIDALFDKEGAESVGAVIEHFRRLNYRGGGGMSPTHKNTVTGRFLDMFNSSFFGKVRALSGSASRGQNKMVDLLMDGEGRQHLLTLTKTKDWTTGALQAAAYLTSNYLVDAKFADEHKSVLTPKNAFGGRSTGYPDEVPYQSNPLGAQQ